MDRKKETRQGWGTERRVAKKHANHTMAFGAVAMFLAMWALGTFGVGHLFGVI